jgi:signal transduction histidine kinase
MDRKTIRVLLIEDNPGDAALVREMLRDIEPEAFAVKIASRLDGGIGFLQGEDFDIVVLDLNLPDSQGLATFDNTQAANPDLPIILLTGLEDEQMAEEAVKAGAQDYLVKGQIESKLLDRAIRYAIERKRIVTENVRLYRDAEEANRAKDEFLATLSHELRTPLNAILGWIVMLQQKKLNTAETDRAFASIERNARLQSHLISELLDLSRVVSGKLHINARPLNLIPVIHASIDSIRIAAQAKRIDIDLDLDPASGMVSGDPDRLQQMLWNLLANSVKFTGAGGAIQVKLLNRSDDTIEIRVSDTGKGIARDFLPHVFERFRQGDASTTRAYAGLGLGLAIVRHLVELHGGIVAAESEGEGRGSTFIVRLPVLGSDTLANESDPHPQVASPELPSLTDSRILIGDDSNVPSKEPE